MIQSKTEKLRTVAESFVAMTFQEIVLLGQEFECEPENIVKWAEDYLAPITVSADQQS